MAATATAPAPEKAATEFELPTARIAPVTQNPKNLILFSKPKVGKTTLLAGLDNCLLIDAEDGSDYVSAMKVKVRSISDIAKLGRSIMAAGRPYKYIAIDTITALENMCVSRAEELYANTLQGKNWFAEGKPKYKTILNLPNGAGYPWLKAAFDEVTNYLKTLAPYFIQVGHIKDVLLEKNGSEFNSSDLDLTGKLKRSTTSHADAIGYIFRKGNQNILTFKTSDEVACGARPEHLRNAEFVISEILEDGTTVTYWDRVYK